MGYFVEPSSQRFAPGCNAGSRPTIPPTRPIPRTRGGSTAEAHFEYSPFGRVIHSTGSPEDFAFRFSTKCSDGETGLLYYGFRYFDPETGRWVSRDPIGERGGFNLYGFVGNRPLDSIDYLGLFDTNYRILLQDPDICGDRKKEICAELADEVRRRGESLYRWYAGHASNGQGSQSDRSPADRVESVIDFLGVAGDVSGLISPEGNASRGLGKVATALSVGADLGNLLVGIEEGRRDLIVDGAGGLAKTGLNFGASKIISRSKTLGSATGGLLAGGLIFKFGTDNITSRQEVAISQEHIDGILEGAQITRQAHNIYNAMADIQAEFCD